MYKLLKGKGISIPKGSIKSDAGKVVGTDACVSIPKGSIKRIELVSLLFREIVVSIPKGSIKRHRWTCRHHTYGNFNSKRFD